MQQLPSQSLERTYSWVGGGFMRDPHLTLQYRGAGYRRERLLLIMGELFGGKGAY